MLPPQLVVIEGLPGAGKRTLARALQQQLPDYLFITVPHALTEAPLDEEAACGAAMDALKLQYRTWMHALRTAKETNCGLVFDSSIQSQLILLHQRFPANRELRAFASSLLRALPQPHVAIFLELSAEVAASRTRVLSVEALRKLEPKYAELSAQLRGEGSLIFRRDWTQFGAANSVRDAILSSPPSQGFNWARSLAPPSEAASERMLEDMLAAAKAVVTHKEIPNAKTEGRAVSPISPAAVADLSLA